MNSELDQYILGLLRAQIQEFLRNLRAEGLTKFLIKNEYIQERVKGKVVYAYNSSYLQATGIFDIKKSSLREDGKFDTILIFSASKAREIFNS